jgi:hypothetical protein
MESHRLAATIVVLCCAAGSAVATSRLELTPEISSVAPNPAPPTSSPQAITVGGRNFVDHLTLSIVTPSGAVMQYADEAITYRRDTSVQAMVTLAVAGTYRVTVTNPDGKASSPFTLTAKSPAAGPSISAIEPQDLARSTNPQTLTVIGAQFVPGLTAMITDPAGTVITINGSAVGQVSPTSVSLTATLEIAGNYEIVVTNPSGGVSNPFGFKVGGAVAGLHAVHR